MRTALRTLIALASIATPVFAVDKDQFAAEIEGAKPVLWKDYLPLYHDFVGCIAGIEPGRLSHPVCAQLDERRGRMLFDALKQAVRVNVSSPQKQKFCADHVMRIVTDQDAVEGSAIAAYMIDYQLHGGAGPYGSYVFHATCDDHVITYYRARAATYESSQRFVIAVACVVILLSLAGLLGHLLHSRMRHSNTA